MKFLFDLLFFLVAAHKRQCRKGDDDISEHRICCRLLFCWFMVAGNTGQGMFVANSPTTCAIMTIDQSLHLVRELVGRLV